MAVRVNVYMRRKKIDCDIVLFEQILYPICDNMLYERPKYWIEQFVKSETLAINPSIVTLHQLVGVQWSDLSSHI